MTETILICSCERTMPLQEPAAATLGAAVVCDHQLCGAGLGKLRAALAAGGPVTVGCTFMQPLFEAEAEEAGFAGALRFADVREQAGWSDEAAAAGPKTAALLAGAAVPAPPVALAPLASQGVALILGRDETAVEAGRRLAEALDVTVLLERPGEIAPPARADFPVLRGAVRAAAGWLGAFTLTVDDYAAPAPSSRGALRWGPARDGAQSRCDLILDLRGGPGLFPAGLRAGYLRADPGDPAAVARAVAEAAGLVGEFDRPRYVSFDAGLCAHSRSRKTGCTRCLDLCPAGAIAPAGDTVAIDPNICAGCGQCAGACPTGAASYALPPADTLAARLRAMLGAYAAAGGRDAAVLVHDLDHGAPLIAALAHHGPGLPARVIPLAVNETTALGPELVAAAVAYGAGSVAVLGRARPRHDPAGLRAALALANAALEGWGYGRPALLVETDDPDALRAALDALPAGPARPAPSRFLPPAKKRALLTTAFEEAHRVAPAPVESLPMPAGAPFGGVALKADACTLCLACVSACPAGALSDNPEAPMLRFSEKLCVQCGLCEATCPEDAIAIVPRLDIAAWGRERAVLKEEPPFPCVRCGKPFGVRSGIEKVKATLSAHWMFAGPEGAERARSLEMCEDCRVQTAAAAGFDPTGERHVRTTEDWLRERDG